MISLKKNKKQTCGLIYNNTVGEYEVNLSGSKNYNNLILKKCCGFFNIYITI